MKAIKLHAVVGCALLLAGSVARAQVTIATFDGAALGSTTPYTESLATFTSAPAAGAFAIAKVQDVDPSASPTDRFLLESGSGNTLTITFAGSAVDPSFDLFLSSADAAALTFDGFGPIGVSGGAINPADPATYYRTGVTILSTVNVITLTGATSQLIGVDNFAARSVTPAVPEPGAIAFLLGGVFPFALAGRRWVQGRRRNFQRP